MKLDPAFEHVGGVAVTECMAAEVVVFFVETALGFGDVNGGPDAGLAHGFLVIVEGLAQAFAGAFPATPDAGEEPLGIAMAAPKSTKPLEKFRTDGDFTRPPAFGIFGGDTDDEALPVDVLGTDVNGLGETKSALIKDGEEGAVATVPKGAQKQGDFLASEDVGEGFLALDFDLGPDLPFEAEVVPVEGAQGADGLVDSASPAVEINLEMKKEVEDMPAL